MCAIFRSVPPKSDQRLSGADGFSRTIPIEKALHRDTLLAYRMNGEKLPGNHGFPVRAIIPGWYGMDSVKWLRSVELLASEDPPPDYVRQVKSILGGTRPAEPVKEILVKSAFTRPRDGAILTSRRFILRGVAWAGENRIQQVDVSTDGGKNWQPAHVAAAQPYAWTPWRLEWRLPRAGDHELIVRAKDDKGRQQPSERPFSRVDGYEQNVCQTIKVTAA